MAATAGLQSKIRGFGLLIASSGGISQVVNHNPRVGGSKSLLRYQ